MNTLSAGIGVLVVFLGLTLLSVLGCKNDGARPVAIIPLSFQCWASWKMPH